MAQALTAAMVQAFERHGNAVLLGEDVAVSGGVFRISAGMLDRFGPERVIDTPLNESGIVGTAIGMALGGGRPIAELAGDVATCATSGCLRHFQLQVASPASDS